jgi:SH3-like domain-containing protein
LGILICIKSGMTTMQMIVRFAFFLLAAFAGVQLAAADKPAGTEPRIALVVGNADYRDEQKLVNPANDAALIADSLRKVGFDVVLLTDANQKQLEHAIIDFGDRLSKAGPDATGLFYFAGHGVQVEGENYLIPVDAAITREAEVEVDAVQADLVLKQMAFAGSRVNIVILDACRNNPLARDYRGLASNQGFAEIRTKPKGTFISYSTAPGEVAVDGTDGHSPFAEALAKAMQLPGLDLPEVFQHVREQVLDATDQRQTPWDSSSLVKSFYFIPPQKDELVAAADPAGTTRGDGATPNHDPHHLVLVRTAVQAETVAPPVGETANPQPAPKAAAVPTFVAAKNTLYAKANARLRAAPSTAADVVTKLAANAPLRAVARSTDGAWWQVALADGREGYVHRDAVTGYRPAPILPTTTVPVAVAAPQRVPMSARPHGPLGFVNDAMNWLANAAGTAGSSVVGPKVVRTER